MPSPSLAVAPLLTLALLAALPAHAAGFRHVTIPDPGNPPIEANIWYPSSTAPRPTPLGLQTQNVAAGAPLAGTGLALIAIAHGAGGSANNHYDTGIALADAGFIAVAPSFTGDTLNDHSKTMQIWNRPRLLHAVIDYMLTTWPDHARINAHRIGAFGFSAGGFTVLVAAGATPDFSKIAPFCAAHQQDWTCGMIAHYRDPTAQQPPLPASVWIHDPRIRAAAIAAPALGYTFGKSGLAAVQIPIQLWRAEDDRILPSPNYAEAVRDDLPAKPDYHVVAKADHIDFLSPCSDALAHAAPMICLTETGFDRTAFHQELNKSLIAFFQTNLRD